MVENGFVTEGTSSTAFILDVNGTIRTQPLGHHILPGVTRRAVLRLAQEEGLAIEERPFTVAEAMQAREAFRGAYEAWMVENGFVTEGTSSTAFILDVNGSIRTQPLGHHILPGVTRRAVLRLAQEKGLAIEERPFTVAEAMHAREAFITAASAFVLPVVEIDGKPVGDGRPGPAAKEFRRLYIEEARKG